MSENKTLQKILALTAVTAVTIHCVNKYISKIATSKDLLSDRDGQYYSWRFGRIFYEIKGEGTPILLIHDLNECSSSVEWSNVIKELSKTNKVYAIDLLGCGRSEKPNFTYTNYLYVQLISEFIKNIIKEKTNIVATGLSAAPSIMAAKINPEIIDKMMFINPISLKELNQVPTYNTKMRKHILTCPIIGTLLYHILHKKDAIYNTFMNQYYSNPCGDFEKLSDSYYESCHRNESGSRYLFASLQGRFMNMSIIHGVKSINHSVILIGTSDNYGIEEIMQEYVEYNAAIETEIMEAGNYLPQLEYPEKIIEAIAQYL